MSIERGTSEARSELSARSGGYTAATSTIGRDGVQNFGEAQRAVVGSRGGRRRRRSAERQMVPDATFTSYYGRPIVKPAPWTADIPGYLFFGGLAGGSALLGAGADLTGRPALRRTARFGALGAVAASGYLLVHDLGRPSRFLNMLRVAKPTSPMSVGTWILSAFGPAAGVAAAAELGRYLPDRLDWLRDMLAAVDRPAGLAAAALGPAVASYTAVLITDTATPSWHEGYREMPFVFVGSAALAAGGLGMLGAPTDQAGAARRLVVGGALLELAAEQQMEKSMGIAAEPLHQGIAGKFMRMSKALTAVGTLGAVFAGRNRGIAAGSGVALLAGSACTRFGIFHAGQQSAQDPKYTVVPQRERMRARTSR
ncbi:MAG TPA: NrfD/PsrC family molybdoenzyme membrane anchor subunit [Jatrophihabitans sp.]|nr:NrfD/PsrC family molybdoenzyme membrane anchor subunit [Jatrophihabitans sp.]